MTISDDLNRYVEYLQRQLITPETEDLANSERAWFLENRERIRLELQEMSAKFDGEADQPFKRLERSIADFKPTTAYDSFHAKGIFLPIVERIRGYMRKGGIQLKSDIIFASSPAVGPNAVSRPSAGGHMLFVGRGTFAFCNYWAKVFTDIMAELRDRATEPYRRLSRDDVREILQEEPVGGLVLMMAMYYAARGTLIGFGRVEQPEERHLGRAAMVTAMETFVVGHEIHHFVAEEAYPETGGLSKTATEKDLETACDIFALSMCTVYGAEDDNPFALLCTGPLQLFWAIKICEDARSKILGLEPHVSATHPPLEERIALIPKLVSEVCRPENREGYLAAITEANDMAAAVHSFVMRRIEQLQIKLPRPAPFRGGY